MTTVAPPREETLHPGSPPHLWAVRLYDWALLGLVVMMSLFNTLGPWPGTARLPLYLVLMGGYVAIGLGLAVWCALRGQRWWKLPTGAWVTLAAGTALFVYALVSTTFNRQVIWVGKARRVTEVPHDITTTPLLCALVTLWAAFLVVVLTQPQDRFPLLWRLSVLVAPLSVVGWARVWLDDHSQRLWTQMGGSAVYPVVLLLAGAIAAAGVVRPYRPRASLWLVVTHLILLMLTGSRAALVMLAAVAVLLVVRLGRTHKGLGERLARLPKRVFVLAGGALVAGTLLSPVLGRLDQRSLGRVQTWLVGWVAIKSHWERVVFGLGSGTIWPWFAYESGWQPLPWRSRLTGPFGYTLYHSHSVYLEVMAELGLVGLALLALVISPVVIQWIRGGPAASVAMSSGLVATGIGFAVDTYLFKNYPISLVWWLVVFVVLTTYPNGYPAGAEDPPPLATPVVGVPVVEPEPVHSPLTSQIATTPAPVPVAPEPER
ncbi:O-antigen ligase family protein [Aestuariimicrobium kwangyangense]|uniref:O-antigen ligase family protein n=1 Tax=Aestuariimicrobium kwangyangense TaxID=396389 RepID=UPI0003B5CFD3|nr:O-antigen ligase family protein [Aestuariimicrobium kwangyangense]